MKRAVMQWARRLAFHASHGVLTVMAGAAVLVLVAVALAGPLGYKVLVDHSDSMQPAIAAGDVIVMRVARADEAQVGDIVSFRDPDRSGRLLTHRVVERTVRPTRYHFVTRGDANTGVERWSIAERGDLGKMVARVPKAGRALVWMRTGMTQLLLLALTSLALVVTLVRRIWSL